METPATHTFLLLNASTSPATVPLVRVPKGWACFFHFLPSQRITVGMG
ncbi:hypothetical protein [Thermomonospora curvata]|nr:hypothetical protein [Thermomonospora curvata]